MNDQFGIESPQPRKTPGAVMAVGIISIVYGLLSLLCCGGVGVVGLMAVSSGEVDVPLTAWDKIVPVLNILLGVALLASGIGTLKRHSWSRTLAMVVAIGYLIVAVGNIALSATARPAGQGDPDMPQAEQIGFLIGKFVGAAALCVYPIVLLIFYNRPKVKALFSGATEDPWSQITEDR